MLKNPDPSIHDLQTTRANAIIIEYIDDFTAKREIAPPQNGESLIQ
jgi:hypothetical protein